MGSWSRYIPVPKVIVLPRACLYATLSSEMHEKFRRRHTDYFSVLRARPCTLSIFFSRRILETGVHAWIKAQSQMAVWYNLF